MTLLAGGLTYRLVELQLQNPEEFVEIGRQQRFRTVQLAGGRGDILDRNGNSLATSLPSTSFFVDPQYVEDPIGDAPRLAAVIGRPTEEVRNILGSSGRFAWLARQVDDGKAAEILALDIPGVFTTSEPDRFQPSGPSLARSVIGNVNIDGEGMSGVEKIFEDVLHGESGELSIEIGRGGPTIPGQREITEVPVPGADVVLTIDRALQFEVERVLVDQVYAMGAKGGVVMVADPSTGEILAMANVGHEGDDVRLDYRCRYRRQRFSLHRARHVRAVGLQIHRLLAAPDGGDEHCGHHDDLVECRHREVGREPRR